MGFIFIPNIFKIAKKITIEIGGKCNKHSKFHQVMMIIRKSVTFLVFMGIR